MTGKVSRYGHGMDGHPALERARVWARLLDRRFRLGPVPVGLDPVLGLIPGLGDLVTVAGGIVMVVSAHQLGLSAWVKAKIVGYTAVDFLVGSIPVLGDIFDFAYTAHIYSLRAIEQGLERREKKGAIRPGPGRRRGS